MFFVHSKRPERSISPQAEINPNSRKDSSTIEVITIAEEIKKLKAQCRQVPLTSNLKLRLKKSTTKRSVHSVLKGMQSTVRSSESGIPLWESFNQGVHKTDIFVPVPFETCGPKNEEKRIVCKAVLEAQRRHRAWKPHDSTVGMPTTLAVRPGLQAVYSFEHFVLFFGMWAFLQFRCEPICFCVFQNVDMTHQHSTHRSTQCTHLHSSLQRCSLEQV